ncbi:MAG: hypothetical protein NZ901_06450 [Geminocystis sp.]|nr:hypothetical protein [Geminocystis sp.]MCS7147819.1 hypothetical protein [Geminocystis sp.]MDW8116814.1 hypothetical protein [Geminocystis sp.]
MSPRFCSLLFLFLISLSLSSCASQKQAACRHIFWTVKDLNRQLQPFFASRDSKKVADAIPIFQQHSQKLLNLPHEELRKHREDLANIFLQYAAVTSDFLSAKATKDTETVIFSLQKLHSLSQKQSSLLGQIHLHCQSP